MGAMGAMGAVGAIGAMGAISSLPTSPLSSIHPPPYSEKPTEFFNEGFEKDPLDFDCKVLNHEKLNLETTENTKNV